MADALQGTWVFNEQLNTTTLATTYVNFTSNGKTCSSIQREYYTRPFITDAMLYNFDGSDKNVYDSSTWANDGYKTITITSKLSEVTNGDTLLTWLQANATKQEETPTYPKINSFTYHGKQINKINGKPIRYVHDKRAGMDNTYEMVYLDPNANYLRDADGYVLQDCDGVYLEFTEELATPQNVTADGTTVSWDEVENATSYEIFANGVSIGTVEVGAVSNFTLSDGAVLLTSDGQIFNIKEN